MNPPIMLFHRFLKLAFELARFTWAAETVLSLMVLPQLVTGHAGKVTLVTEARLFTAMLLLLMFLLMIVRLEYRLTDVTKYRHHFNTRTLNKNGSVQF